LVLIASACLGAYIYTREYSLIPKAILKVPQVFVSHSDLLVIIKIFLIGYFLQIMISFIHYKSHALSASKRFADEYICYLFTYTTLSLYIFLATTINYDAQLVAGIGLFSTVLYIIAFVIYRAVAKRQSLLKLITEATVTLLKRLCTLSGVLMLLYFLVPLMLGKAFSSDRDVANKITQLRIWFNPVATTDWGFKNIYPQHKFHQPVLAKQATQDDDSIYVLERFGGVYRADFPNNDDAPEMILDISTLLGEVEVENGAIGMAFNPTDIDQNKRPNKVYVHYTDTRDPNTQFNRISAFDLTQTGLSARLESEQVLLQLARTSDGFHNGGSIEFGPDGYLYIALGEGVHPKGNNSAAITLRSGILRIDVNLESATSTPPQHNYEYAIAKHYLIPNDNPFVGNPMIMDEYWALGLRNPFRFTFDKPSGELWLGDVGSTAWEEINKIEPGFHYQFPHIEGNLASDKINKEGLPERGPIYTYQHSAYDRAVIGGIIYRGSDLPRLTGKYIFADNYSAKLFALDPIASPETPQLIARANQFAQRGASSVTQLSGGQILMTTLGAASAPSGQILQLVPVSEATLVMADETEEELPESYDEKIVASLFAVNCARCHGIKGDGEGPDAKLLGVELPDFTSPLYHAMTTKDEIQHIIEQGGAAVGKSPLMPPWGGFLKPHEIDNLTLYLQSLPAKHHHH